jgi:hypothetical protein
MFKPQRARQQLLFPHHLLALLPLSFACALPATLDADPSQLLSTASFYAWMFFTIACAVLIAATLQQYSFAVMGAALSKRVRQMLFRAMLRQDIGYVLAFEGVSSGPLGLTVILCDGVLLIVVGDNVAWLVLEQSLAPLLPACTSEPLAGNMHTCDVCSLPWATCASSTHSLLPLSLVLQVV